MTVASERAVVRRDLTIARAGIKIVADESIADAVLAPFAHLVAREPRNTSLTIEIERLDRPNDGVDDSGEVIVDGARIVHLQRDSTAVFDRDAGRIRAMVRIEEGVASWIRAKPLQVPLSIFFASRGVDLVHGGLVSRNGNGILLAGSGGAGKSTLAISSLSAGLDFLGDDCVAAEGLTGYSVFGSGCMVQHGEKVVLPVARLFPEGMAVSTTIRAIVLPRITHGERVDMRPASGRDALLALAPGSILKRAVPPHEALARMARLVRDVPSFVLEMGPVGEACVRMRELLESLA